MSRNFSEVMDDIKGQLDTNEFIGHVTITPEDFSVKTAVGMPLHDWLAQQYPGIEVRIKL